HIAVEQVLRHRHPLVHKLAEIVTGNLKEAAWAQGDSGGAIAAARAGSREGADTARVFTGMFQRVNDDPLAADIAGQLYLAVEQHPEQVGWLALAEERLSRGKRHLGAHFRQGVDLVVAELLEEEGGV